eukprot:3160079-Pyramimonas_sp.AAC.1
MSAPANLFWTSACYLTATFTSLFGDSDGSGCVDPRVVVDVLNGGFGVGVVQIVFHVVFSKFAVSRIERLLYRRELQAAKSILAGVCDSVVEVDD